MTRETDGQAPNLGPAGAGQELTAEERAYIQTTARSVADGYPGVDARDARRLAPLALRLLADLDRKDAEIERLSRELRESGVLVAYLRERIRLIGEQR